MSGTVGWLPSPVEDLFGTEATAEESYDVLTVDVPPSSWLTALETARTRLTCTYFDWLSAVDEPGTGFRVSAHVVALSPVRRLLLRTTVPHEAPALPSAVGVYAGAAWHERETHEMFGVHFEGHPSLDHLLLPETFEGHPLRKDFVLAARVAKSWPGAKEPGESDHGGPKRRQMLPPGVPDPNEWGPLKGQLPPAPTRPARATGRTAAAPGDRPTRRTRTAAEGSASQTETALTGPATPPGSPATTEASATATARPRRARTAAEGSASQTEAATPTPDPSAAAAAAAARPRRARTAAEGSVSQPPAPAQAETPSAAETPSTTEAPEETGTSKATESPGATEATEATEASARPRRARTAAQGSASQQGAPRTPTVPRTPSSPDAPWHHARPAFDEPDTKPESERADDGDEQKAEPGPNGGLPGGPQRRDEPRPRGISESTPGAAPGQTPSSHQPPAAAPDSDSLETDSSETDSSETDSSEPNSAQPPEDPAGGPQ
ncbi:NADH-quinone oxidoreductase subunit C [Streptomyces sp. NPDC005648]|uniref:NADH-quinone oxidoreductase subunit C n=1 Tax=Streptomyces sp. NPDC005648 TaxID=3157044 RepID=UPI0033ABFE55